MWVFAWWVFIQPWGCLQEICWLLISDFEGESIQTFKFIISIEFNTFMPVLVLLRSCEEWKAELQVVCFAVKTLMVSFTHTVFPSLLSLTHYSRTLGLKEKRSLWLFQAVKFLLLTSLQRLFEISGSHHIGNMELKFTGLAKLLPVNVNCVHAVIKQKMQVTYSQIQWRLLRSCANKHFLFAS